MLHRSYRHLIYLLQFNKCLLSIWCQRLSILWSSIDPYIKHKYTSMLRSNIWKPKDKTWIFNTVSQWIETLPSRVASCFDPWCWECWHGAPSHPLCVGTTTPLCFNTSPWMKSVSMCQTATDNPKSYLQPWYKLRWIKRKDSEQQFV